MESLSKDIETGKVMNEEIRNQILKNNPLVSVIVPVYNVQDYLSTCVQSIVDQTYTNLEIILVDDGSKDQSGLLCDQWKEKDERIQVVHQENGGLSAARNTGIEHAKGEYFLFVDSDDYILPTMVEDLYVYSQLYDGDITECGFEWLVQGASFHQVDSVVVEIFTPEQVIKRLREVRFVVQWNKLFKREIFDTIRYADGRIHEDEFIVHHQLLNAKRIVCINKKLYIYNALRPNSITASSGSMKRFYDVCLAFWDRLETLEKHQMEPECYYPTLIYFVNRILKYLAASPSSPDKDEFLPKFREMAKRLENKYGDKIKKCVGKKQQKMLWLYNHAYAFHVIYDCAIKKSKRFDL